MFCKTCDTDKPEDEFPFRSLKTGKRQSNCKACHKLMRRAHYERNYDKERSRISENKMMNVKRWREYKETLSCSQCGENHPATIDFHHLNREEKDFNISYEVRSLSWKRLMEEVEKCIVLCANCHRKLHWEERNDAGIV